MIIIIIVITINNSYYSLFSIITTPVAVASYVCPFGWLSWGDNCYLVSRRSELRKTWDQARTICQQMQGELLHVESQAEHVGVIFSFTVLTIFARNFIYYPLSSHKHLRNVLRLLAQFLI